MVPTIRYLVDDVDMAEAVSVDQLGFARVARMGPASGIVEREGLSLWLSGPQTSAAQPMPDGRTPEPGGRNRLVVEIDDVAARRSRSSTRAPGSSAWRSLR